jgi:hypothetical protein
MIKKLTIAAALMMGACGAAQSATDGDWKVYPTFDNYFNQVVVTPSKTYIVALSQYYNTQISQYSTLLGNLFVYDKEGDEFKAYTNRDKLTEPIVAKIAYNEKSNYLLVVYDNGNIDLIYDNGKIKNIPGLKNVTLTTGKGVNDIVFCPEYNEAYIATEFGFLIINDRSGVITKSRNFGASVNSACRVGDFIYFLSGGACYYGSVNDNSFALSDYSRVEDNYLNGSKYLLPLGGTERFAAADGVDLYICYRTDENSGSIRTVVNKGYNPLRRVQRTDKGYVLYCANGSTVYYSLLEYDNANVTRITPPEGITAYASSWDFKEFWMALPRQGVGTYKYSDEGTWSVTREPAMPNAPTAYLSVGDNMGYSSKYGVLMTNHGATRAYPAYENPTTPNLLCGVKNGEWTTYAPIYRNPTYGTALNNPYGLAIDPDNSDYVYFGSWYNGIIRLNLADADDVLHMTHPTDPAASLPSYRKLDDDDPTWTQFFLFSAPKFDSYGNLWACRSVGFPSNFPDYKPIYVWPAEKRKAGDVDGWAKISFPDFTYTFSGSILPLTASGHKNLVVIDDGVFGGTIYVLDTNGTPSDPSDDKYATISKIYDQDGNSLDRQYTQTLYEDPSTGKVWVGHTGGLYMFDPVSVFSDPMSVERVKVSRNDGSSLADYLLDGVTVTKIVADKSGNKWYATNGGGIIETSSSGKTVLRQLLADETYLPSDEVLDLCYNPDNNSLLISTTKGYAEYFIPGSAGGTTYDNVKAYPNPVRPDYTGWITIEGLAENSLVKIVNAQGSVVKELGIATGGSIQWDGTNMNRTKVNSGVYYVFVSSSDELNTEANVTKIVVVK